MAASINRVVLVGNLTRDPELRHTPSGTPVCSLRLAVNTRRKDESGQWTDKPNYFDITVWGQQGENCAQYLAKGRPVAIRRPPRVARVGCAGRLERQAVESSPRASIPRRAPDGETAAYVPAGRARARLRAATIFRRLRNDDIPFCA